MLGPVMRALLLTSGPMNAGGALLFAPPLAGLRRGLGLPAAEPFYLWILSAWVLAFGVAYWHMGWTGRADRGVLAIGAWGKAVFALSVFALAAGGGVAPLAVAGALPDLVMAAAFAWWLWRTRAGHAGARR